MPTSARRGADSACTRVGGCRPGAPRVAGWGRAPLPDAVVPRRVRPCRDAPQPRRAGHEPLDARRRAPGGPTGPGEPAPAPAARGAAAEDLSPEEQAQLEAMQAQMEQVQAQLLAAPAARGRRQPRHGPLRAGRPPPHAAGAQAGRGEPGHRRARRRWWRGSQGRLGEDEDTVREALGAAPRRLPGGPGAPRGRQRATPRRSIRVTHGEVTPTTSRDTGHVASSRTGTAGGTTGGGRRRGAPARPAGRHRRPGRGARRRGHAPLPEPRRPPAPRAQRRARRPGRCPPSRWWRPPTCACSRSRCSRRCTSTGGGPATSRCVTEIGRRGPDALHAPAPPVRRRRAHRRSPGSPATSAPRRPCTSGCTRRSSRTSSPGSPTGRSSSTGSTCRCAARPATTRRSRCCS